MQEGSGLREAGGQRFGGGLSTAKQRLGMLKYHRTFETMGVLLQARRQWGSWCKVLRSRSQSSCTTFNGGLSPATSGWFKDL